MILRFALLLALAATAAGGDDRPPRAVDPALQGRIQRAISRGAAALIGIQRPEGYWTGPNGAATAGKTALSLYALASSGIRREAPSIQSALAWVRAHPGGYRPSATYATYSASILVLALTRIDPTRYQGEIAQLAERIAKGQRRSGGWSYQLGGGGVPDNSNSQFAVLALWAAESRAEVEVPRETWRRVLDLYRRTQGKKGGWGYSVAAPGGGRPSMIAAGLVSSACAAAALARRPGALLAARRNDVVERGLGAFRRALPRVGYGNYYEAYCVERTGTVLGLPLADWYVPGARVLLRAQQKTGTCGTAYETSLALLFLTRATRHATTPGERPGSAVTAREKFPDLSDPAQIARGFDFYHGYGPERRRALAPAFGKAGPAAIGHFIERLRDPRRPVRATAAELLDRLLEKRFLFDASWTPREREIMLGPIERFWKRSGDALVFDPRRGRFVLR